MGIKLGMQSHRYLLLLRFVVKGFLVRDCWERSFPGGSDGKKICLQCRRPEFDPWVGKILWRRKWLPTPGGA